MNITQTTYNADTNPEITSIWVPDLELVNQDDSLVDSFSPKQAQVYPDGTVFWSRVGSLNALCAFSGIKRHPFDENECTVDFGGWARSGLVANYSLMDEPITFGGTGTARTSYQEYSLVPSKVRAAVQDFYYPCCPNEPWPTVSFTFVFKRETTVLYLRTLTIPVLLLTILASAVFWFDVRCGERLGYGITVLLSITAVEIIASESLPTCPELLWIEAFTSGSFMFSVCCLVESCYVTYLYFKQRKEDLTEWIKTECSKREESSSGVVADDMSFFSCDSAGMVLSRSQSKSSEPSPPPEETILVSDVETAPNGTLKRFKRPRKNKKRDMSSAEKWAVERDLDPAQFNLVRRIDKIAFRIFALTYSLYVIFMFASVPIWSDDYAHEL